MPDPTSPERVRKLAEDLLKLPGVLFVALEKFIRRFQRPKITTPLGHTSIFPEGFVEHLGVYLCLHHCFSDEPFTKDKFEYAVVMAAKACGASAEKARMGLRGHDVTVSNIRVSLKTEAAKTISENEIHISKFMELGKGEWRTEEAHLHEKRDQFLEHLQGYDRIFTLRCLNPRGGKTWKYELVEIPKALLQRANCGEFTMMHASRQTTATPGYCRVFDGGERIFELYFDGGTERKLQIRHLLKCHCAVVATWEFGRDP